MAEVPTSALVRRPSAAFTPAYQDQGIAIDPERAERQHGAYVGALRDAGLAVTVLDGDPGYYDSVFVEDTAVVWGSSALIVRMGSKHRDGEQASVREALRGTHTLFEVPEGGTIDGGDVLHCEDLTFVGRSSRTNEIGIAAVRRFLEPHGRTVIAVPVERALHLKTGVTYLGDGVLIAARELIDVTALSRFDVISTAPGEQGAANCLRIGDRLLIPAGYPITERIVSRFAAQRGISVHALNISEFEKASGGLTCLSILWSPS